MSNDQPESSRSDTTSSQHDVGLMLQKRALHRLDRANEKPYRSPKRIALVSLAVVVTMSLFLMMIDKGVKVAHHIIDIWTPVIFDNKKPAASETQKSAANPSTPYMIKVEPANQSSESQSSVSRSK